uniref:Uncharacterized protein n=1 Tax=Rhodosorus marinus TaxID=101924 RepID=A0A7S0G475_9RHOD|mmetsp:Transcript_4755/g.6601  ORF Transcript_4755/g.6601 Transcript_4755/m.6601 type:complete len:372 (+) Transcript_4755:244-1359(+)
MSKPERREAHVVGEEGMIPERKRGVPNGAHIPTIGKKRTSSQSRLEHALWLFAFFSVLLIILILSPASKVLTSFGQARRQPGKAFMHGDMPTTIWESFLANNTRNPFELPKVRDAVVAWKSMNEVWQFRILDFNSARDMIEKDMSDDDLLVYDALTSIEERELFLKVTVLYYHGGVFSDINIIPKSPIEEWIPVECNFACGYEDYDNLSVVVLASAPRHRVIRRVYEEMMKLAKMRLEEGQPEGKPLLSGQDFTSAVSTALVGTAENNADSLWRLHGNIVTSDRKICLFPSKSALQHELVERIPVGDLFSPDPTPHLEFETEAEMKPDSSEAELDEEELEHGEEAEEKAEEETSDVESQEEQLRRFSGLAQ